MIFLECSGDILKIRLGGLHRRKVRNHLGQLFPAVRQFLLAH